ncbi:MAG: hypothetical protein AB7S80_16785 [Rhizobiaceae bacterium]
MKRVFMSAVLPLMLAATANTGLAGVGNASEKDKKFFQGVSGEWRGPGEIVAGKYKGTKFTCTFQGSTPDGKIGLIFDGGCRVGVFTQKMSATIEKTGKGYRGSFLDGSQGKGLDVTYGNVDDNKVIMSLIRNQLKGVMLAKLKGEDDMNVTISVSVDKQMVPVIGISLRRVDGTAVGSVASRD